jgi:outer membrane biosynthesis protein TonB
LLPEGPERDGDLHAPAVWAAPIRRGPVAWRSSAVSLLLHALLLLLILIGLPDWLRRHQPEQTAIEVTLVQPPPPPAPPPKPAAKPPAPPPPAPLSSDAQSEGPKRPSPAEKAEAAPAAPEPGPQAAPPRKVETPPATPSAKPAPAEPKRAPTPPPPRAALAVPQAAPAPASPSQRKAAETETALATPPPERAPTSRGEAPPAPRSGKAPRTGFSVVAATEPPGGEQAALYDAYLAAVRDKIAGQRRLLRTFYGVGGRLAIRLVIDPVGRLTAFGTLVSSGSYSLDYTVNQMVALAAPFGPPPASLAGVDLVLNMLLPDSEADWNALMAGQPG